MKCQTKLWIRTRDGRIFKALGRHRKTACLHLSLLLYIFVPASARTVHSFLHAPSMTALITKALFFLAAATVANAYWLMAAEDFITTERMDPIVNPGKVSGHVHSVVGGSNFRLTTTTESLRNSECSSIPIPQDKSSYWFPHLYFQWSNGSFTSLTGGAVIYYLFSNQPGTTTAFPDDFRMLSGDPTLRTYNPSSFAQQAVTFLCLDFEGTSIRYNELPATTCASGIRAQINFPSCWDGKNLDSSDHKSHVAFLSDGPDQGSCSDPDYPVTLPRIFMEVYWDSNAFDANRNDAMNSTQPFVYSYGDPTGYGYHADFLNGWDEGILQKAVDGCNCDPNGDPTCCVNKGIFDMNKGQQCHITPSINETTTGTLSELPGNNPVQKEGMPATMFTDPVTPALLSPVYAYTGSTPPATGQVATPAVTAAGSAPTASPTSSLPSSSSPASSASPSSGSQVSTKGGNVDANSPSGTSSSPTGNAPRSTCKSGKDKRWRNNEPRGGPALRRASAYHDASRRSVQPRPHVY